ncbi:MAG: DNA-binding response regulator [Nocardioides sp.]|nr:DNA-binding response regulator [Nocardioides sp.]
MADHLLAAVGMDAAAEHLYRSLLRHSGGPVEDLARTTGRTVPVLERDLAPLRAAGLVRVARGRVTPVDPGEVLPALIAEESRRLGQQEERLRALHDAVPVLRAEHERPVEEPAVALVGEVLEGADLAAAYVALVEQGSGPLRWLRPTVDIGRSDDPGVRALEDAVRTAVSHGRRSQAVYPARALQQAPGELRTRAAYGEEIRVMAAVPSYLSILGDAGVVLPEVWGSETGSRTVVRGPGLVRLAELAFRGLWERALPIPGLEPRQTDRRSRERTLLLEQLAGGAKDEQIARVLGLGLRTVRRRVAEVMEELAVETRFQAGMEAVRRGWL